MFYVNFFHLNLSWRFWHISKCFPTSGIESLACRGPIIPSWLICAQACGSVPLEGKCDVAHSVPSSKSCTSCRAMCRHSNAGSQGRSGNGDNMGPGRWGLGGQVRGCAGRAGWGNPGRLRCRVSSVSPRLAPGRFRVGVHWCGAVRAGKGGGWAGCGMGRVYVPGVFLGDLCINWRTQVAWRASLSLAGKVLRMGKTS